MSQSKKVQAAALMARMAAIAPPVPGFEADVCVRDVVAVVTVSFDAE